MITDTAIAKRFEAGESVESLAEKLYKRLGLAYPFTARLYVERAIREVLKRQHRRTHGHP